MNQVSGTVLNLNAGSTLNESLERVEKRCREFMKNVPTDYLFTQKAYDMFADQLKVRKQQTPYEFYKGTPLSVFPDKASLQIAIVDFLERKRRPAVVWDHPIESDKFVFVEPNDVEQLVTMFTKYA